MARTRRLVLRKRSTDEAAQFADSKGWSILPEQNSDPVRKSTAWSVDDNTVFQVTRDRASGEFSCFFHGPDEELLESLLAEAERALDTWPTQQLLDAVYEAESPQQLVRAVFRLGIGAPPSHSTRFMPALAHALAHEHPMVRAAAARSTAYMEWPELLPILEATAGNDVDPRVREEAGQVISAYHHAGIGDV
ncbi:HEAT repeat domain-containing protein [Streptomyces sp. NPDC006283]|uniref:HEAT repeat domain-containing protein n=1 Tax=Streptomyces sp. NPDC006283 TaxID=3156741 RepID=UPI0033BF707E